MTYPAPATDSSVVRTTAALLAAGSLAACEAGAQPARTPGPSRNAAPTAEPAPSPEPATSAAVPEATAPAFQLSKPATDEQLMSWRERLGCRLLSGDGSRYACIVGGEPDMGFTLVALEVRSLSDGRKLERFELYNGRLEVEQKSFGAGFADANHYLKVHDFREVEPPAEKWNARVEEGRVVVSRGARSGSRAAPPFPKEAPTDALEQRVDECCHWKAVAAVPFTEHQRVSVRLARVCAFGWPHSDAPPPCKDADYHPENDHPVEGFTVVPVERRE